MCTESALSAMVASGGVVDYDASCTDIAFSTPINVGTGVAVTIDGNGLLAAGSECAP